MARPVAFLAPQGHWKKAVEPLINPSYLITAVLSCDCLLNIVWLNGTRHLKLPTWTVGNYDGLFTDQSMNGLYDKSISCIGKKITHQLHRNKHGTMQVTSLQSDMTQFLFYLYLSGLKSMVGFLDISLLLCCPSVICNVLCFITDTEALWRHAVTGRHIYIYDTCLFVWIVRAKEGNLYLFP